MQMKKQEQGEWLLGTGTESFDGSTTTTSASNDSNTNQGQKAESGAGGSVSDILKKLREKREQELKNESASEQPKNPAEKVQNENP
jgi:hypothetical protein